MTMVFLKVKKMSFLKVSNLDIKVYVEVQRKQVISSTLIY